MDPSYACQITPRYNFFLLCFFGNEGGKDNAPTGLVEQDDPAICPLQMMVA